jgi:hypothetical protein
MLTERNEIVAVCAENIPQALRDASRWAIWKAEPAAAANGTAKLDKVPYCSLQPNVHARNNDPSTWSDFNSAYAAYLDRERTGADGLLFALGGGFAAGDIDDASDVDGVLLTDEVQRIIEQIDSYAERSVSGRGVRIFAYGPEVKGIKVGSIEIYSRLRFMTVTGQHLEGTPIEVADRSTQLEQLREQLRREREEQYRQRRADRAASHAFSSGATFSEADASELGISDDEIIDTAYDMDGFVELWHGSTAAYDGDASRADLALASRLAFLCGPGQHERVFRLMHQSGLVRRKWQDRPTYLTEFTIPKAYEGRTEYYSWTTPTGFSSYQERASRLAAYVAATYASDFSETQEMATVAVEPTVGREEQRRSGAVAGRPTIILGPETDAILCELESHMAAHLFQMNNQLVRVERQESDPQHSQVRRPVGAHHIVTVPHEMTQRLLSRHVKFLKIESTGQGKERKREVKQAAAPATLAKLFTNCGSWKNIPQLTGITTTPFMRDDGVIVSTPGFDAASGYLFIDDGTAWEPVPDSPTEAEVKAAADLLHHVVCDFPFEKPEHRSAWVATLLTTVGRPAIFGPVPMLWVDGNRKGTGKSKLPRLISEIACGHDPTEISYTSEEKELENRLVAVLLAGDRIAVFDNATGAIRNPVLDRFLTSTIFSSRAFFKQKNLRLLNNTVLAITGNNLTLRGDLSRRILRVRLVTDLERPDKRNDFTHPDLFGFVRCNRARLFAAALTILRAHAAAGFPVPTIHTAAPDGTVTTSEVRPVGSFRVWDKIVRHALLRIGLPDPATTQDEAFEEDESDVKLLTFLRAWHAWLGPMQATATELIEKATHEPFLAGKSDENACSEMAFHRDYRVALLELTETEPGKTPSAKTLGYRLRDARDAIIGGYRLAKSHSRDGVVYRVVHEGGADQLA